MSWLVGRLAGWPAGRPGSQPVSLSVIETQLQNPVRETVSESWSVVRICCHGIFSPFLRKSGSAYQMCLTLLKLVLYISSYSSFGAGSVASLELEHKSPSI